MDQTIVGNDVRQREDPGVALLGEDVTAGPGQRPGRRDQGLVHPVHPADDRAGAGEIELRRRRAGQHAGRRAGLDQSAHGGGGELHIRIQVDPGEGDASRVTEAQGVRLARHCRLDDLNTLDLGGRRGGAVGARVRHDDDLELAGRGTVEQPTQVGGDDGFLVMSRYHDADYRLAHAFSPSSPVRVVVAGLTIRTESEHR